MQRKKIIYILVGFFSFFVLLKSCCLDVKKVVGNSMKPTLFSGKRIILFKLAYGIKMPFSNRYLIRWAYPKKNDIIVYVMHNRFVIKRCAATANQPLEFLPHSDYSTDRMYKLIIEEKSVPLTSLQFKNLCGNREFRFFVPKGSLLALGDNASESEDSRDYGFVSIDSIYGKAFAR
ncbi:signal peptidase I [Treponema phagedenis]|uniref:signal peptidase I n=1 Tax=Treponema phagedenis TaxID=162 RepID=UPI0001F63774|nr:signal peptidase I [Treponema phagedenis]EFW36926.1 signal peptidase I [Treponema phagedenis F0421]TYT76717.1 signal peptidase I [Treponema phagedenis]TYT76795.1 signal peptidase I [Treponema phagedenis]TYT77642.1 signal peptidase I [Treponema phagedenis]